MLDDFLKEKKETLELVKFEFGDMGNWYEVRHMKYKPYMAQFDRIQTKFNKFKKGGRPFNEQKERNEMAEAFVSHLLTDWKMTSGKAVFKKAFPDIETIATDDKKIVEIPFSKKTAYELLKDQRMEKLFQYMIINCADHDSFEKSNFEDDLKN